MSDKREAKYTCDKIIDMNRMGASHICEWRKTMVNPIVKLLVQTTMKKNYRERYYTNISKKINMKASSVEISKNRTI